MGGRSGQKINNTSNNSNTIPEVDEIIPNLDRPLTTMEKNAIFFEESAKRRDLKTAPKDYKDGFYSVETKNYNKFEENIGKLSDIKSNSTASVKYVAAGQLSEVRRDGNLYTVTKQAFKKDGSLSVNRRKIYSKAAFENGDLRDIL